MSITAEQFAGIVRELNSRESDVPLDKRRAIRVKHRACVEITICAEEGKPQHRLSFLLSNISARGIGLVSHIAIPRGQQFILHLPHEPQEWLEILCTIVYCRSKPGGLYSVGAEFNCPVSKGKISDEFEEQISRIRTSILK